MNEQPKREVTVLSAALELRPTQRAAYLDQACAGDAVLRQQVEDLLQAHAEAEGFLEEQPAEIGFQRTAKVNAPLTEKPGDKIARYKLLQQIGEGGCGVVYMAEQEEPVRRRVALKVIKLGMDTKQVIARFEAERQALALMDHPNIAKVLDAGATETGRPYFVMELVRGIKITEFCDEHKVSTQDRLKLFIQVCQSIQHAHQKGIIHRDIKPSNILVTINDGVPVPKVIDFGIAKATQGRLTDKTLFTAFEQFIGTPAYMSPEQAVMTSLDVDTRGDIYSLGVLLYELITGRTPFDQKELLAAGLDEMRRTIREKEPPKPSTRLRTLLAADLTTTASCRQTEPPRLIHSVRGDLDWIVMKALEKDRTRRYETANGLATDVQRYLNNEPVTARPPSNLYRLQKMVQRNRLVFAAATVGTVAIMAALIILGMSNVRITKEKNQKDIALQEKDGALKEKGAALEAAHASEQRGKEQLFLSLKSQAQARRYSRQMGQRLDSLAALSEAARIRVDPGLRDEAIAAMALPDVRLGPRWQAWETNSKAMTFDSLYQRYARVDNRGTISIRSVSDDRELQRLDSTPLTEQNRVWGGFLFSPDGRFLAYMEEGNRPRVWRLGDAHSVLHDAPKECTAAAFSADSRQITFGQGDSLLSFDLVTGRERNRWKTSGGIYALAISPDNRRVAVGYFDQDHVSVFDGTNGREISRLPVGPRQRAPVCWDPDGQRLAVGGSDPRIQIWEVEARLKLATLEGHVEQVSYLTFHPEGELLASASWDGLVRLWDPASGREAMQIPVSASLQFSKDGRWLGVTEPTAEQGQLLEVIPSQEYHTLENSSGARHVGSHSCAISPDSRLLAVGMNDGVRLWDLTTRRELAFLAIGVTTSVLFSPDGQELLTCGHSNLQRWPIQTAETDSLELRLGPPHPIPLPFVPTRISRSRDGRTLGVISEVSEKTAILELAGGSIRSRQLAHPQAGFVALSPDARWLATSGWHSDSVRLWNAQTGEMIRELVAGRQTRVSFTPDSVQLIIARADEFSFLDVNTLEIKRRLRREIGLYPQDVAFSPDDQLMAMEMAPGMIHLNEVSTGRTLAKLTDPYADRSNGMAFTPDGTKLIVLATYADAIHVWDLRAIRAGLKPMGLDWDWPEFPPPNKFEESRASLARPSLKVQVISAETR